MALAVVPVVPHDCPPNRGMHAKRHITPERNLSSRSSGVFASHFAPANLQDVFIFSERTPSLLLLLGSTAQLIGQLVCSLVGILAWGTRASIMTKNTLMCDAHVCA